VKNRREALKIIGAVGVTCAFPFSANELYGQHVSPEPMAAGQAVAPGAPFTPGFFSASEFQVVCCLADLIIPSTETPGAVAAGVPEYVDLVVTHDQKLQRIFREGLPNLDAVSQSRFARARFLELTEAQQVEILTSLQDAAEQKRIAREVVIAGDAAFFNALKSLIADGYYTSRVGLLQELGYNGNDYLAAFPEFRIAEH
jgi:gluconate 2-dehydrogenase gamma chain